MNRLLLDYFRRWWWVLALVGIFEFRLGWSIARRPEDPFEWWAFCLVLWAGAVMLSFDFQRGLIRAVAVLPVRSGKAGLGWWLATVPIPAAGLSALLFLGAVTFCHFHPGHSFPAQRLALGSLFNLVWLGIEFVLIFNSTRGFGAGFGELALNGFISCLAMLMFFGSMLLCRDAAKSPLRSGILLGLAGC